jgi:hypothetical protein
MEHNFDIPLQPKTNSDIFFQAGFPSFTITISYLQCLKVLFSLLVGTSRYFFEENFLHFSCLLNWLILG